MNDTAHPMSKRFRGYFPVVIDVETGGFDSKKDALLEVCAFTLKMDDEGHLEINDSYAAHVEPFDGANLEPKSMEVNGIDPYNPFRMAKPEQLVMSELFGFIRKEQKKNECSRSIMVGHNTTLDLSFINAASNRCHISRNPFHPFSIFDTVSFAGLAYGQTVLARAVMAAGLGWDDSQAHSAIYDAQKTAELFCTIVNRWGEACGPVWSSNQENNE